METLTLEEVMGQVVDLPDLSPTPIAAAELVPHQPQPRELATYNPDAKTIIIPTPISGMTLGFTEGQRTLTAKQMHLLSPLGIEAGWDPAQVAVFLLDCNRRGFDPWANEAYLMLYPGGKFIRHTGIAGFRRKGEESGGYRGRIGPQFSANGVTWLDVWLDKNNPPPAARCGIMREGFDAPLWATAVYDEYAPIQDETRWQDKRGGGREKVKTGRRVPVPMWRAAAEGGKPSVMLGKVAEAQAWRAAFPNRFNGFYAPEEFERARVEHRDDEAAVRRRAAYEAATAKPADAPRSVVIEGKATEALPPSEFSPERERELLVAEMDEQAEVLGKSVAEMSARWSASRDGRPIIDATLAELVEYVHRWRPYIVGALRSANRDEEADLYANAARVGTVQELFGRGPAVPEPPAGDAA